MIKSSLCVLNFLFFFNVTSFYDSIQCDLYILSCNKKCELSYFHASCKKVCDKLFKMWTGLDLMQSLQCAIPEGDRIHYELLTDAIYVLSELRKCKKDEFIDHSSDLRALESLLTHIVNHDVVFHIHPLKKIIEICNDMVKNFNKSLQGDILRL